VSGVKRVEKLCFLADCGKIPPWNLLPMSSGTLRNGLFGKRSRQLVAAKRHPHPLHHRVGVVLHLVRRGGLSRPARYRDAGGADAREGGIRTSHACGVVSAFFAQVGKEATEV
jgi:hypothetical protein